MTRIVLSIGLIFAILVSNVGVPVYRHVCHSMEKAWASAWIPAKSCCKKSSDDLTICADKDNEGITLEARPCCENHMGYAQMESDFGPSSPDAMKFHALAHAIASKWNSTGLHALVHKFQATILHPPPSLFHGRSLLAFTQVFRI